MSHHDTTWDPGHGEPGHVHDESWTGQMMATDDPATTTTDGTAPVNQEAGGAALGGVVAGPAGAVVGGAVGAAGGAGLGDRAKEEVDESGAADYVDPRRV